MLRFLNMSFLQGAQDLKKAKWYSRVGKEVVSAMQKGGPNPVSNPVLAAILEKAKELGVQACSHVNVRASDAGKDQLLGIALDAGAEDVIDPPYDDEEISESYYYKIVSSPENYSAITSKPREEGIKFEPDNGSELLPINPVDVDDEAMHLNKELMSELLELDDVDAVYSDQK
ncbi:hypothetical protein Droror1_Dr00027783 [Drosera rotundifolia]